MKQQNKFSIGSRIKSFTYALNGLKILFKTEHNSWIHLFSSCAVILLGIALDITATDWCLLIIAIGFVFVAEIVNTSIEYLTDLVSPEYNETAKKVKDLAAAGVLCASLIALCIGLFVFLPRII